VDQWRLLRLADKVASGDVVYLWQAAREEAVLGWGAVEGEPYPDPSDPRNFRVPVRYENRLSEPLTRTALRDDARLQHLSILRSPQGANFTVTTEQAVILNRMMRSRDPAVGAGLYPPWVRRCCSTPSWQSEPTRSVPFSTRPAGWRSGRKHWRPFGTST
jgi:hypothetical protein